MKNVTNYLYDRHIEVIRHVEDNGGRPAAFDNNHRKRNRPSSQTSVNCPSGPISFL